MGTISNSEKDLTNGQLPLNHAHVVESCNQKEFFHAPGNMHDKDKYLPFAGLEGSYSNCSIRELAT